MISAKVFKEKLEAARALLSKKRFAEAEVLYRELQQHGQERELLLGELVRLYWQIGNADRAIECLEELTRIFPDQLAYYLDLVHVCEQCGRLQKAAEGYGALLARKPDLPNTWYNYARLLKKIGNSPDALNAYQRALDYAVEAPEEVYNNIAVIYSELRQESEAVAALEKAVAVNPQYIPARFNLAGLYEEEGDRVKAGEQYRKILALDPDHYPALCRISNMSHAAGESEEIEREVRAALAKPGLDAGVREELLFAHGKLLDELQRYDAAFASYRQANELGRRRFPPYSKGDQKDKVDEIARHFDRCWFSAASGHSEFRPIFICGMYRSGSTLVEQIISGHSRVTAGGELDYFPELAKEMRRQPLSGEEAGSSGYFDSVAEGYLQYLTRRFGAFDLVTDKRPDNFMHLGLMKAAFPACKIVWTRRYLLDNCLSIYFQYLGGDMNYAVDLDAIGHFYVQQCRLMEHWRSLFPESIYPLSYEQLVDSPESEVRVLLDFLELDWEPACLDFSRRENRVKTASIWQVRQSIHRDSSARYQHYLKYLDVLDQYRDQVP
ncbi:sulfotransferase [Microbulbifer sp. SAOS-129_SWC]|uniref:tetratricopeptide repeat-containing sulfotransferase family protein n=1 Tax=Microbulbifer sp. SAOS-129_SWC TaxID=3145235 RepID=UPI0032171DF3